MKKLNKSRDVYLFVKEKKKKEVLHEFINFEITLKCQTRTIKKTINFASIISPQKNLKLLNFILKNVRNFVNDAVIRKFVLIFACLRRLNRDVV